MRESIRRRNDDPHSGTVNLVMAELERRQKILEGLREGAHSDRPGSLAKAKIKAEEDKVQQLKNALAKFQTSR